MDVATAEFFKKEREQCTTRDAKHVMPIKLIPDLEWKLIENISVMESSNGVTIYCIKEAEDKQNDTQVTKIPEPKTGTVKMTQSSTEAKKPRYDHRENSEDLLPRYEPKENLQKTMEDTIPREITESTCIKAIHMDPTEDTKTDLSDQRIDTVEITEIGTLGPTVDTYKESTVSMTTERDAEHQINKTHKYPTIYNPIVNKIFSVFRQAKESLDTIPM